MGVGNDIHMHDSVMQLKEDVQALSQELFYLKREYRDLLAENLLLKRKVNTIEASQPTLGKEDIKGIISETVKAMRSQSPVEEHFLKKINRNKRQLIKSRILELANFKNQSLPEVKETVVDQEHLCSKATFYRYAEKLKDQGLIDLVTLEEKSIVVRV